MSGLMLQWSPTFWAAALKSKMLYSLHLAQLQRSPPSDSHAQSILTSRRSVICEFTQSLPFVWEPKSTFRTSWSFVAGHRAVVGVPSEQGDVPLPCFVCHTVDK